MTERERAEKWLCERGTNKSFTQVAKEWREHLWTAEDCVRLSEEIIDLLTEYGQASAREQMERDCAAICPGCAHGWLLGEVAPWNSTRPNKAWHKLLNETTYFCQAADVRESFNREAVTPHSFCDRVNCNKFCTEPGCPCRCHKRGTPQEKP